MRAVFTSDFIMLTGAFGFRVVLVVVVVDLDLDLDRSG